MSLLSDSSGHAVRTGLLLEDSWMPNSSMVSHLDSLRPLLRPGSQISVWEGNLLSIQLPGLACGVRVTPGRTGLRLPPPQPSSNSTSSNSFTYLLAYQPMAKLPHLLHLSVFDMRSLELQLPDTIGAGHRIPASRRRSRMKMDASAGSAEMLRAREICLGASTDKKGGRVDVRDTKGKL